MNRWLYMHTLNGMPAEFHVGDKHVYVEKAVTRLAGSLRQIRREQKVSAAWFVERGHDPPKYGYVRIAKDAAEGGD